MTKGQSKILVLLSMEKGSKGRQLMGRYRKSMKDSLKEARLYGIEETTSYHPNEINKKKHALIKALKEVNTK